MVTLLSIFAPLVVSRDNTIALLVCSVVLYRRNYICDARRISLTTENLPSILPQRQSSIRKEEENRYITDKEHNMKSPFDTLRHSPRLVAFTPAKRFLLGASVSLVLIGTLFVIGFFDNRAMSSPSTSTTHRRSAGVRPASLRGTVGDIGPAAGPAAAASLASTLTGGVLFPRSEDVDHHKPRVMMIPSLKSFSRRNVHHYDTHDPNGRLSGGKSAVKPPAGSRGKKRRESKEEDTAVHVEDVDIDDDGKRRSASPDAEDILNIEHASDKLAVVLPHEYETTGVVSHFHSITGVDSNHNFDVNDYFGSSVTSLGGTPGTGLTTLAVGAPGALENSGMIYFLDLEKDGKVKNYTYLTNKDSSLGDHWTSNVALGWTVENIGDLDGDGVDDLAVGAIGYPVGSSQGAVYILFMTPERGIKSHQFITTGEAGFEPFLKENSCFGSSIARIGDLDGDGVTELAVGAMGLGKQRGGIYILYMNKDGTVKKSTQISSLYGWDHKLNVEDQFGHAVRAIGDLDGDGITELAVGGDGFPSGEFYGSVWILYLTKEGGVKQWRRIDELDGHLEPESLFGGSIDTLGDLDGDGFPELIVGAPGANGFKGDAFIVSLGANATVKHYKSLVDEVGVLSDSIKEEDEFAWSLCNIGDINGDGVPDLALGAETSPADKNFGSLHVVFLTPR